MKLISNFYCKLIEHPKKGRGYYNFDKDLFVKANEPLLNSIFGFFSTENTTNEAISLGGLRI